MKETIIRNGKEFKYKGYRIEPDTYLPAVFKDGQKLLDPEVLFEGEDGIVIGLHPDSNLLSQEE